MTTTAHRIVYTAPTGARCVERVIGAPDLDSAVAFIQRRGGIIRELTRNGITGLWAEVIDADAAYEWGELDNLFSHN